MICLKDLGAGKLAVTNKGQWLGTIQTSHNTYHASYTYLALNFLAYPQALAPSLFALLTEQLGPGFQVPLPSSQGEQIAFLTAAGFRCKRKCYEVAIPTKTTDKTQEGPALLTANKGSASFLQCARLQLDHYKKCHLAVSPWTASDKDFLDSLPSLVYYEKIQGEVVACAFIEDKELAYLYGRDKQSLQAFFPKVLQQVSNHYPSLFFEVDDCDPIAMEVGRSFIPSIQETWDTYILT